MATSENTLLLNVNVFYSYKVSYIIYLTTHQQFRGVLNLGALIMLQNNQDKCQESIFKRTLFEHTSLQPLNCCASVYNIAVTDMSDTFSRILVHKKNFVLKRQAVFRLVSFITMNLAKSRELQLIWVIWYIDHQTGGSLFSENVFHLSKFEVFM